MLESPVLQEHKAGWTGEAARRATREAHRQDILDILIARFEAVAQDLTAGLGAIKDEAQLKELVKAAAMCPDLESYRQRLSP